jgi:hypothetical protein
VPVEPDRLRQWRLVIEQVAKVTAKLLGTDRSPRVRLPRRAWTLGAIPHGKERVEVTLDSEVDDERPGYGLIVTLSGAPADTDGPVIGLPQLVAFKDHRLDLNWPALKHVLNSRLDDPRIACEIKFEHRLPIKWTKRPRFPHPLPLLVHIA